MLRYIAPFQMSERGAGKPSSAYLCAKQVASCIAIFVGLTLTSVSWGEPETDPTNDRRLRARPVGKPSAAKAVALDIGHTPKRAGCRSATGKTEYSFNKEIAQLVYTRLQGSESVLPLLVNEQGKEISLMERTKEAAARRAQLFVSIHHDAVNPKYMLPWVVNGARESYSDRFSGFSVFYSRKNLNLKSSVSFATLLGRRLRDAGFKPTWHHAEPIRGENRKLVDKELGIYEFDDLIVLKTAKMPAVLVECGVIVNRNEEEALRSHAVRSRIAGAIASSIEAFFTENGGAQDAPP